MTVHRLAKYQTADPFTRVPNAAINDQALDLKARGLLLVMLSKPDGWRFNERNLARDVGVGRAQLRTAIATLIDAGYVTREHVVGDKGVPVMVTSVYDEAQDVGAEPGPAPGSDSPQDRLPVGLETEPRSNEVVLPTNENPATNDTPTSTDVDEQLIVVDFEDAWTSYPKRKGKRVGKAAAKAKWDKLTTQDRVACFTAIGHYRQACDAGETIAKDMERFLKADYWRDWMDPAEPSTNGVRSTGRRATVSDWSDDTGGEF